MRVKPWKAHCTWLSMADLMCVCDENAAQVGSIFSSSKLLTLNVPTHACVCSWPFPRGAPRPRRQGACCTHAPRGITVQSQQPPPRTLTPIKPTVDYTSTSTRGRNALAFRARTIVRLDKPFTEKLNANK